mgnify:CR=1 FL=1
MITIKNKFDNVLFGHFWKLSGEDIFQIEKKLK